MIQNAFTKLRQLRPHMGMLCLVTALWIGLGSLLSPALSQNILGSKKKDPPLDIRSKKVYEYLRFERINDYQYYYDKKRRREIERLREEQKVEELTRALTQYIKNFGPQNFRRDQNLLWELAQLYEKQDNEEVALYLYAILLKHTDTRVKEIRDYYYEVRGGDPRERYVPIDYYYKLVDYRKNIDTLRPPKGIFVNMGPNINSRYADYGPYMSRDMTRLLFTSKRNRVENYMGEIANEDIFVSERMDPEAEWEPARPVRGINSSYNEGSAALSPDGQSLYFIRCQTPDGLGSCDIYTATRNDTGGWTNIRNLGPNINTRSWDSHPSLSKGGDTLFFVSDRLEGFGGIDIYYATRNSRGEWNKARNLGPIVNTAGNEMSPFYHPRYKLLYFSSDRQIMNYGSYDIYKTYQQGTLWQEPINIGPLVNGRGNEYYFTIDPNSEFLFYARSESDQVKGLDLYSFPLPMAAQPRATTSFEGKLVDEQTGEAFQGIVSVIDMEKGVEVAPKFLKEDGSFKFNLIKDRNYLLVIQGDDFFRVEKEIDLQGDSSVNLSTPSINFIRLQFESIEFGVGSSDIKPYMKEDLDKLTGFLLSHPKMELNISGHTDAQGDEAFNMRLSQDRADAIREYMIERGSIAPERITAKGYGSSKPIVKSPQTEAQRKLNRRVEFEIVTDGESGIPEGRSDFLKN